MAALEEQLRDEGRLVLTCTLLSVSSGFASAQEDIRGEAPFPLSILWLISYVNLASTTAIVASITASTGGLERHITSAKDSILEEVGTSRDAVRADIAQATSEVREIVTQTHRGGCAFWRVASALTRRLFRPH